MKALLAISVLSAAMAAGCGSTNGRDSSFDPEARFECIREEGLPARFVGPTTIQVGAGDAGPRITMFRTAGEAETKAFVGDAPDAEQIGTALLDVNRGSDDTLKKVEMCLE